MFSCFVLCCSLIWSNEHHSRYVYVSFNSSKLISIIIYVAKYKMCNYCIILWNVEEIGFTHRAFIIFTAWLDRKVVNNVLNYFDIIFFFFLLNYVCNFVISVKSRTLCSSFSAVLTALKADHLSDTVHSPLVICNKQFNL